jgi:protein TonB
MGVPRRTTTSPAKTAVAPTKTKTPTATKTGTTGSATTGTGRDSATEIARRLRNAVASAGGTQYGDGTTAGGGSGRSSRIGSPLGAENGMIGGVNGPGSANWPYYMHVRERMYEAWGQPGGVSDRGLVAVVQIRVARDGSILDATLKRSSGNRAMDLSALEAARKVKLLEPPPSALVQGSAAEISIDFKMEG